MIYIDNKPNESGAYPNAKNQPFPDCIELNEEQSAIFFEYNGFVIVSQNEDGSTNVEPNVELWEEWKASLPSDEKIPAELREEAYNTETIISWDNEMITVTAASQLWQYYAAEGSDKANELQALIAEAKADIRAKYPDESEV